ncbi:MAG TPA: toast rack family protein [Candidatus Acidoferrum sp.]|nr:toast rack family protein [Candidatus Acidoferrum sp.]
MPHDGSPRRASLVFPITLIAIGAIFLYSNWHPEFDPWPILWTYWPLILIFIGLGTIWDYWRRRRNPDVPPGSSLGPTLGVVLFVVVLLALFWHGARFRHWRGRGNTVYAMQHTSQTVDRGDAKTVRVSLDLGAGDLDLSGGSSHLLEADFNYRPADGAPRVDYSVSGTQGRLNITQEDSSPHFGTVGENRWTLHLANDIPIELKIDMGAGHDNLRLRDIAVTRLNVDMGAGQADVDLTGDRKADLTADIEGGVGEANIRLPKNIGVIINASGGIGSIEAPGLHHDGDEYTNDAYGKTPVTIHLKVSGGVGSIRLIQEF